MQDSSNCAPSSERNAKSRLFATGVVVALATMVMAVGACSSKSEAEERVKALENYGDLPAFSFQSQEDQAFTDKDMRGHVTIANFIFTRCPSICPVFTMKMQRIGEKTSEKIHLVSFSVDPEYDTPARLLEYSKNYDANPARWHFLTGDSAAVKEIVEGALKISMVRNGEDEHGVPDIVHGSHFVLFDSKGSIRGYYNSDELERVDALRADAEALAQLDN